MTKWIVAITMTLGAFTASASSPTASAPDDDQVGTCSYTCTTTNVTYINRTQCRANCSGTCVIEAC
ncbi:MAG TPA: hypothetical protein VK427_26685 [Kofleriaceae bacterium]|nr:hypothetical protein [Kofleriaceae bacterium]